jgi:hypothetical protein
MRQILTAMDEYGYCVVPSVLSESEARGLAQIIVDLQDAEARPDGEQLGHRRVLHLLVKHPVFLDLLCHPLAMAVMETYLGPDFVCSTWSSNCILPGADLTYWHVERRDRRNEVRRQIASASEPAGARWQLRP